MTRMRGLQPQLSESWASVEASQDDITSTASEEEFQPRLREAYYNSHRSPTLPNSAYLDDPQPREGPSHDQPSSQQQTRRTEPEFVMPSPESSEYLDAPIKRPMRQSPRQATRASGIRRSTPIKRVNPTVQPERRGRKATKTSPQDESVDYVKSIWLNLVLPLLKYMFSILSITMNALKPLLGYALLVLLLATGFGVAKTMVYQTVTNALSPLCHVPGAGFLNLPFCGISHQDQSRGPVEFDKLVVTQSNFEEVLQASVDQAALPMAMKNSELSIRDLRTVVKYSHLGSRNELVNEFDGFIETARQASDGLSHFNSRISRALDGILSANRWTMKVLQGIEATPDSEGAIPRWINENLPILSPLFSVPRHSTEDVLYDQYIRHTSEVEEQIQVCILEANTLLEVLDNLDERLGQIHDIAHREGLKVADAKGELLGVLWTKLGANRGALAKHEQNLDTLKDVTRYRDSAVQHVSVALLKLKDIQGNLGHLRDDVAAPRIVDREKLPLEMHIDLISSAVDRLQTVRDEGRKEKEKMLKSTLDQISERDANMRIG